MKRDFDYYDRCKRISSSSMYVKLVFVSLAVFLTIAGVSYLSIIAVITAIMYSLFMLYAGMLSNLISDLYADVMVNFPLNKPIFKPIHKANKLNTILRIGTVFGMIIISLVTGIARIESPKHYTWIWLAVLFGFWVALQLIEKAVCDNIIRAIVRFDISLRRTTV